MFRGFSEFVENISDVSRIFRAIRRKIACVSRILRIYRKHYGFSKCSSTQSNRGFAILCSKELLDSDAKNASMVLPFRGKYGLSVRGHGNHSPVYHYNQDIFLFVIQCDRTALSIFIASFHFLSVSAENF